MDEEHNDDEQPTYLVAHGPETGTAVFVFDPATVEEVATSQFSDGSNRHPRGRSADLLRTPSGRWVWRRWSQWVGEQYCSHVAATDANGLAFDSEEVEAFLARHGTSADVIRWRCDIDEPIPFA